jgi:Lhr-like helicase
MNALANNQLEELDKFVSNVEGEQPVTFARYTGQESAETRRAIADNPPDILLTNFMMLELLMTRQDEVDRRVIGNCVGLRFLVLDELRLTVVVKELTSPCSCDVCANAWLPNACNVLVRPRRWPARDR